MPVANNYAALQIKISPLEEASYQVDMQFNMPAHDTKKEPITNARVTIPDQELLTALSDGNEVAYGARLFRALFPTEKERTEFLIALELAANRNLPLHVRLDLGATPELTSLRWELLHIAEKALPLGASERTAFARMLPTISSTPVAPLDRPLKSALVAIAAPKNLGERGYAPIDVVDQRAINLGEHSYAPIDVADQRAILQAPLSGLELRTLDHTEGAPVTRAHLRSAMREKPDIVCLIAHGKVIDGESYIVLEDDDQKVEHISASELAAQLKDLPHPQLMVLIMCESAGSDGFTNMAPALGPLLAESGIPAVMAVQGQLTMASSRQLLPSFLREVRRTGVVDQALAAARKNVRDDQRPDWSRIILWQRMEHGQLWAPSPDISPGKHTSSASSAAPSQRRPTPGSPDEMLIQAEAAYSLQEWATAIELYKRYLKLRPGDEAAQQSLTEAQRLAALHLRYQELEHLRRDEQEEAVLRELHALRLDGYTADPRGHRVWAVSRQHFRQRFDQAVRSYRTKVWADALTLLKSLLFDYPDDQNVRKLADQAQQELEHIALSEITTSIQNGHIAAALDAADARLRQHPDDYEALWETAQLIERADVPRAQRLRAAQLVQHRDLRPGVMTVRPTWATTIPAAVYQLSEGLTVPVTEFRVARYPVTMAQYEEFKAAGAYMDLPAANRWWTPAGLRWRATKEITGRQIIPNQPLPTPHMPVSGVSWYEATAFCNWLTQRGHTDGWLPQGQIIRLPTEAEWELAARWDGATGQLRDWQPDSLDWLNCDDHDPPFDHLTPVGMFPLGAKLSEAFDMAGNVWELCASPAGHYPVQADAVAADFPPGQSTVPVRGGSFKEPLHRCGWTNRWILAADTRADHVGFRVCCVSGEESNDHSHS